MKLRLLPVIASVLLFASTPSVSAQPASVVPPETAYVLEHRQLNVTGAAKQGLQQVLLVGHKEKPNDPDYRSFLIMVHNESDKLVMLFSLPVGGTEPKLQFPALTATKVPYILFSAKATHSTAPSTFRLFSVKDNKPLELPLPPTLSVSGQFQDQYKARIYVKEEQKMYILDVRNRRSMYEQMGLFANGKLLSPTSLQTAAYVDLHPDDSNKDGIYELQTIQRVNGTNRADTLAYVIATWKWDRNKWKRISVKVQTQR